MKELEKLDKRSGIYEIDPEDARKLLDAQNAKNRPLSKMRVARYISDIKRGKWRLTGEPILLSPGGALLDGQHRLSACASAGKPFVAVVLYGNWPFQVLGQGKPRSAADVLGISGIANRVGVASVAKLVIWHNRALSREASMFTQTANQEDNWKVVHNEEVEAWVTKHSEICDLYSEAMRLAGNKPLIPTSPMVAAWWLAQGVTSEKEARDFFEPLISGIGLQSGDVRLLMRRSYQGFRRGARISLSSLETFADIAKAWNVRKRKGGNIFVRKPSEPFHMFR